MRRSRVQFMNSNDERPDPGNPYSTPQSGVERKVDLGQVPLASLTQRLGAALLDGALMWMCLLGPAMVSGDLGFLLEGLQSEDPEQLNAALGGGGYTATPILLMTLAIFNLVLLYRDGQTIGKRMLGTRIVRVSGQRAVFLRIIGLRVLVPGVIYMLPFVGVLLMFFGHAAILLNQRRCLHDYIADTKVVTG
ncbi:MAG: putative RDD family membrane protein YckC [Glaciecola sp.]